jgi:hypothetical protein
MDLEAKPKEETKQENQEKEYQTEQETPKEETGYDEAAAYADEIMKKARGEEADTDKKPKEQKAEKEQKQADTKDTGDDKPADEKAEEKSGQDKKDVQPELDKALIERAQELGLDAQEAKSFKNQSDLEKTLDIIEKGREDQADRQQEDKQQKEQADKEQQDDFELKTEDFEEELADQLKGLHQYHQSQKEKLNESFQKQSETIEKQNKAIEDMTKAMGDMMEQIYTDRFEASLDALEDDLREVVGQGSIEDINDDQLKVRNEILREMSLEAERAAKNKSPVPSFKKRFNRAKEIVLKDKIQTLRDKETAKRLKQRAKQKLGNPSSQKGSGSSTEDDAVSFADQFIKTARGE